MYQTDDVTRPYRPLESDRCTCTWNKVNLQNKNRYQILHVLFYKEFYIS